MYKKTIYVGDAAFKELEHIREMEKAKLEAMNIFIRPTWDHVIMTLIRNQARK